MSTFGSLNAVTTSLWAQRRGLDVTGQNIANVNTEGYSRQRVDLQAIGGSAVPAFFSTSPGIGAGVNADDVIRIRDAFLEGRGHIEHANSAQLTAETDAYELVERSFREPGETGIQSLLADMWKGWQDVANNPKEPAARGQVLQQLETLVGGIHFSQASLGAQWSQTRENLEVLVKDVNASAVTIAQLNKSIRGAVQANLPANDLSDQRDLLIMKLADSIGATIRPGEDGMVDVIVGGMSLVSGTAASAFAVQGPNDPDLITPTDKPRIVTANGGFTVTPGGTAGGQLSSLNVIIPSYRAQLDQLANDLATALNTQHALGWDLDGNPGQPLLGSSGGPLTAESLKVVLADPDLIAASSVGPTGGVAAVDNGNADKIAQLRLSTTGVDATYRKMIVELGVQSAVSKRNLGIQGVITTQVDAARESVSGVNLDEEMSNMLQFQHAYAAAGRMVTAIDQALDVLINRTGIVGR